MKKKEDQVSIMRSSHNTWVKRGLVFVPSGKSDWMISRAQLPVVDRVDDNILRIYFGTRDGLNQTRATFIDVESENPKNILYVHQQPVLDLGKLGAFDENGLTPCSIVNFGKLKFLYYTGYNIGRNVPYRTAIGLAVSEDGGRSFKRLYDGPILDRGPHDPMFCGSPMVLVENDLWRMWYMSCVEWKTYDGIHEPFYHLKYAESRDGISWDRKGIVCISFSSEDEGGIGRPSILKESGFYRMWYSFRGSHEYRTNKKFSYRIGYAESQDGIRWIRKDEEAGIERSGEGWDSEMIEYQCVYKHGNRTYMFYNGNGFGVSGFGYAELSN